MKLSNIGTIIEKHQKMNVCMLLPLTYKPDMLIYPTIGILGYLVNFGHRITWVISSENDATLQESSINGIKVYAIPFKRRPSRGSMFARALNRVVHAISKMRFVGELFKKNKYDLLLVRDDVAYGFLSMLIGTFVRRRFRIPLVLELSNPLEQRDLIKFRGKYKKIDLILAICVEFFAKRLLLHADLILPISKTLQDALVKNKNIPKSKTMPLPEGADTKVFLCHDGEQTKRRHRLNGYSVVVYEGSLGKGRQLNILVETFYKVVKQRSSVKLLLVGSGAGEADLKALVGKLSLVDSVVFTGRVSQSEIPDLLAASDIGISPIPPISFFKFSSPIKMFEYMAAGIPVVANREIPEQEEVLTESEGGILVKYDAEAFTDAIMELLDDPEKAVRMGQKGRDWVVSNRSFEVMARIVEHRFQQLLHSKVVA
jgi:glycosyltransferase involved in cell wall biosynthesis